MKKEDLRLCLKSFENLLKVFLSDERLSTGSIGGKYGELFVANKLWRFSPQIDEERISKNADIYLKALEKRVEVKWGKLQKDDLGAWWAWGFSGGSQIKKEKFDYCVLLASGKNGKPERCFIFTHDELSELTPRKGGIPTKERSYYLAFYQDFDRAQKGQGYYRDKVEIDLNKHPEKYEERWDKIKK